LSLAYQNRSFPAQINKDNLTSKYACISQTENWKLSVDIFKKDIQQELNTFLPSPNRSLDAVTQVIFSMFISLHIIPLEF